MINSLTIKGRRYALPIFCPDATRGVVRSLSTHDLLATGTRGVIVNTWHLHDLVGDQRLSEWGGVKKLMAWEGLTISDSGGFQVFSLFQKQPDFGKITDAGLVTYTGPKKQHKIVFTPEDSIRAQFAIGSDIMICLDDYTGPTATPARIEQSTSRTIAWAARCKREFELECHRHGFTKDNRPLLFAVIQGGRDLAWRKICATELLSIGFDGFGLGGAQFRPDGSLDLDWAAASATLTPDDFPRYALGFGKPDELVALAAAGYQIFDTVLPTRDARHGRLYIHPEKDGSTAKNYQFLNLNRGAFATDFTPPDPQCQCPTCQQYTRAYLHHLLRLGDSAAWRACTIHNLHFYQKIVSQITSSV
ncbi:queuine tRNA-ribosyltransferase family protein [bacterium]|nr:queuine tRNA-ribosyltransferase family protein [bacterium]